MTAEEKTYNISVNGQPIHVKLILNTKGYQWEITVDHETIDGALAALATIDNQLRLQYGGRNNATE